MTDSGSADSGRTIKYAIIGYGVGGSQFLESLILERLILHWTNKAAGVPDVNYKLHITVFSSQTEAEAGAGEGWGPDHDGCINSPIPSPPEILGRENLPSKFQYKRLVDLVSDLPGETGKAIWKDYDGLMARLQKDNKPAAALLLGRSQTEAFDNSKPCVPRAYLGDVRRKSLNAIIDYAQKHMKDYLEVDVKYQTWAVVSDITYPDKPQVKFRPVDAPDSDEDPKVSFDKVISFSGVRRTSLVPKDLRGHIHIGSGKKTEVEKYFEDRKYQGGKGKMIGFVGAKLSFIDCASVVGTDRRLFDLNPSANPKEGPFCTLSKSSQDSDMFVAFTRPGGKGNPAKPRLSFTNEWPHKNPYLETEHILALRTQKNFDWVTKVQFIWKAMISYVKNCHPNEYPEPDEKIADKWKRFSEECKAFRADEKAPTYTGLERILVFALFYGYGAESNVAAANQRVGKEFPAVFVSGERMCAAAFAHPTSIDFLKGRSEPNKGISDILLDWYETFSGSPVEVCEPIFDLAVKGILQHKEADVTKVTKSKEGKIEIGGEELDVVFAPGVFGGGLDEVVKGVLPKLKQQAPGIPLWQKLGQLVDGDGKLVNVWDYGNNRGTGLTYKHGGVESKVKPRMSVSVLTAAYEFAPPLAASMLAHDIYTFGGKPDACASQKLQCAIKQKQPNQDEYDRQIPGLEEFYVEAVRRFHYLKAIESEGDNERWRKYYEKGLTEDGRQAVLKTLQKSEDYDKAVSGINREAMDYDEWYAPFNDLDVPVGWEILKEANHWYQNPSKD